MIRKTILTLLVIFGGGLLSVFTNTGRMLALKDAAGAQLENSDRSYLWFVQTDTAWGFTSLIPLFLFLIVIAIWWSEIKTLVKNFSDGANS